MSNRVSVSQTLKALRSGPCKGVVPPTEREVRDLVTENRSGYINALKVLLRRLADSQLKNPTKNIAGQFAEFSDPWLRDRTDGVSRFYAGYVDAYVVAVKAGLTNLDWQNPEQARRIAENLAPDLPGHETPEGLAWRALFGQIQSAFSRDAAAETFRTVRDHPSSSLVSSFYWDMGAFTYYSEEHVNASRRDILSLSEMTRWSNDVSPRSDHAIVISIDETFFRTFAPMILFNAQQVPQVDFVLLLCADTETAGMLVQDAERYLDSLSSLNWQEPPENIHFHATPKPDWVQNRNAYYASTRFLALPELVERYETVYCMDADLMMMQNPQQFLRRSWPVAMNAPMNRGLISVIPWRRYMAGNLVVTGSAANSSAMRHFVDYLSVGLSEKYSWMLDQNALSYVADLSPSLEFGSLDRPRPGAVAGFMGTWEQNYRNAMSSIYPPR